MSKTRRRFTAEFKANVALDALSGEHTLSELASKYGGIPISQRKKQAKEGVIAPFSNKAQSDQQTSEAQIKELHAKIGQLILALFVMLLPMVSNLWSIQHAFYREFPTPQEKMGWIAVAVFIPVFGELAYIFFGRKRGKKAQ
jgi:transposase